jgi:hypothetical protein
MGDEYNHLGEVCESRKQAKGEEIHMGSYNSFRQSMFLHEQQVESKKRAWSWSNHGGRILEHVGAFLEFLELKTEEPGCQA